jgi:protein gp37
MSDTTTIEWTDSTWNPVTGCTKVTPGCDNCYAETFAERWRGTPGHHFENGFDLTLRPNALTMPLRWRKPRKVFVNSMSDLFHKDIPDEYIARVFAVMALTTQHTYQVLTKRHGRMRSLLNSSDFRLACETAQAELINDESTPMSYYEREQKTSQWWSDFAKPLRNVWLGVSVEDQQRADLRIPALLETPAAVRFLSCEPLLGPVDLHLPVDHSTHERDHIDGTPWPQCLDCSTQDTSVDWTVPDGPGIGWVIVGGESGRNARPMSPDWARDLRDQCQTANVPFFFKQFGEYQPTDRMAIGRPQKGHALVGDPIDDLGHRWEMRRVGKKAAGRELDGRTWNQVPAVTTGVAS